MKKGNGSKTPNHDSGLNFEAQLWAAADKMRGHMDASEYKHVCLGLRRLPPAPLIQKFTDTVAPMLKRISQNIHESRTLAALLPKLLSGELRVPQNLEVA